MSIRRLQRALVTSSINPPSPHTYSPTFIPLLFQNIYGSYPPTTTTHVSRPPSFSFRFVFISSVTCQVRLTLTGLVGLTSRRTCVGNHGCSGPWVQSQPSGEFLPIFQLLCSLYLLFWDAPWALVRRCIDTEIPFRPSTRQSRPWTLTSYQLCVNCCPPQEEVCLALGELFSF